MKTMKLYAKLDTSQMKGTDQKFRAKPGDKIERNPTGAISTE